MSKESIGKFLEELRHSPQVRQKLEGGDRPLKEEEKTAAFLELAKELGHDLTLEDLREYIQEAAEKCAQRTEAQAEAIQKLDDSELEKAAGGADHATCKDSFKDKENCWRNDACDLNLETYPDYLCNHNRNGKMCLEEAMLDCQEFLF